MKASGDELRAALRAELRRLDGSSLQSLLKRFGLPESGVEAAIGRLADPKWSREAIVALSPRTRAGLRMLVRAPSGITSRLLDSVLGLLPLDPPGTEAPSLQLIGRNLVLTRVERHWGRPEEKLTVLDPLRERLAVLVQDESRDVPAPPTEEEEQFALSRFEWQIGVAVAVIDQARPRATMSREPHRTDLQNIRKILTPLFGTEGLADSRLRVLFGTRLFAVLDDRIRLLTQAVQECDSPAILLQSLFLSFRRHSSALRAQLGALLSTDAWLSREELLEVACVALLRSETEWDIAGRVEQELQSLREVPGVELRREEGRAFFRLAAFGREALEGRSVRPMARHAVLVQPNLQLVVSPGTPFTTAARLGALAKLVSADQVAIFAVDEQTVRRSSIDGMPAADVLRLLEEDATHGVPSTVVRAINDWTRVKARAGVGFGALLLVDLPTEELRRILGAKIELLVVKEGIFFVPEGRLEEIVKVLRKAGVSCAPYPEQSPSSEDDGEEEDDEDFVFGSGFEEEEPWEREAREQRGESRTDAQQFREEWKRLMRVAGK